MKFVIVGNSHSQIDVASSESAERRKPGASAVDSD